MSKQKQLVYAGIVTSLIISNAIIGNSYIKDTRNYESQLINQSKIFKQEQTEIHKQSDQITNQLGEFKILTQKNDELQKNLNNANKEIIQLKKESKVRKEVKKPKQLNMNLTFYTSSCDGCSGITATGVDVSNTIYYNGYRIVAADPRVVPLHSIIKIETKNESFTAYVADTGGAIKGMLLDVLVSTESEAFRNGRQKAVITVLKEGA